VRVGKKRRPGVCQKTFKEATKGYCLSTAEGLLWRMNEQCKGGGEKEEEKMLTLSLYESTVAGALYSGIAALWGGGW